MKLLLRCCILFSLCQSLTAEALPHRSQYLVEGLDLVQPAFAEFDGVMYAGLVPFHSKNDRRGNLMFWLFLPHKPSITDTLVLWLNGGPGCSSFDAGVAFEHGPVKVPSHPAGYCCSSSDDPLETNKYAWTRATPMLYVEQPGGTGFSDGTEPQDEDDVAGDMHSFLVNFFTIFDDLHSKRFFLMGESYAGMFVPSIAHTIYLKNQEASTKKINLEGIGIGNAWMDARTQGSTVIDYAFWHGMIDVATRTFLYKEWDKCLTRGSVMTAPLHSFTTPDECGIMDAVLRASGKGLLPHRNPNTYDVTTWDKYPVLTGEGTPTTFEIFFNDERVKEALHAPLDVEWQGCIPGAGRRRHLLLLDDDRPVSVAPYLAQLMDDAQIRVFVYDGDRDMSTNSAGVEMVLNGMTEWSGHNDWQTQTRGLWLDDKHEMAGWSKELQRLSFLVVYNSGHLVPYNLPARSLQLLERFLTNTSFVDVEIPRLEGMNISSDEWHNTLVAGPARVFVLGFLAALVSGVCVYAIATRACRRQQYIKVPST